MPKGKTNIVPVTNAHTTLHEATHTPNRVINTLFSMARSLLYPQDRLFEKSSGIIPHSIQRVAGHTLAIVADPTLAH